MGARARVDICTTVVAVTPQLISGSLSHVKLGGQIVVEARFTVGA